MSWTTSGQNGDTLVPLHERGHRCHCVRTFPTARVHSTSYLYNSIILSLRAVGLVAFGDRQRGRCDSLLAVAGTNRQLGVWLHVRRVVKKDLWETFYKRNNFTLLTAHSFPILLSILKTYVIQMIPLKSMVAVLYMGNGVKRNSYVNSNLTKAAYSF